MTKNRATQSTALSKVVAEYDLDRLVRTKVQIDIQQRESLQALYHLAVELSALRSLESVLNTALRHCLELTDSQFGFVGLTTADSQAMDVVAIQGFHPTNHFYKHHHLIPLHIAISFLVLRT